MKNLLWLDDRRNPYIDSEGKVPKDNGEPYNINWVIDYKQFVQWIQKYGLPDAVSFDHDLSEEHYTPEYLWEDYQASKRHQEAMKKSYVYPTGEDTAKWLKNYCDTNKKKLPQIYIHTANPVGEDWIREALGEAYISIAEYRNRKINEIGHYANVLDVVKFAKADTKWAIDSVVLEIAERWAEEEIGMVKTLKSK